MSRCKACNTKLKDHELLTRTVREEGKVIILEEDLCTYCRGTLYQSAEELEIDPTSLGVDVIMEEEGYV